MNEAILVECAKWIYSRKEGVEWWTPHVLTSHNPDSNPNVNIDVAYDVFAELIRRRLMVHTIVPMAKDRYFPAFKINPEKDAEWQALIKKKGAWSLTILPATIWLVKQSWLLFLFIGGVLLSNYLAIKTESWAKGNTPTQPTEIRINDKQFDMILHPVQPSDKAAQDIAPAHGGGESKVDAYLK